VKPTAKQLRYLRDLANSRGQTFRYPETRAQASAEIRRLRAHKADSRLGVVPSHVVHPGLLGGWLVSKPPVPRRTPDEAAR
jgi:hypothetical protein